MAAGNDDDNNKVVEVIMPPEPLPMGSSTEAMLNATTQAVALALARTAPVAITASMAFDNLDIDNFCRIPTEDTLYTNNMNTNMNTNNRQRHLISFGKRNVFSELESSGGAGRSHTLLDDEEDTLLTWASGATHTFCTLEDEASSSTKEGSRNNDDEEMREKPLAEERSIRWSHHSSLTNTKKGKGGNGGGGSEGSSDYHRGTLTLTPSTKGQVEIAVNEISVNDCSTKKSKYYAGHRKMRGWKKNIRKMIRQNKSSTPKQQEHQQQAAEHEHEHEATVISFRHNQAADPTQQGHQKATVISSSNPVDSIQQKTELVEGEREREHECDSVSMSTAEAESSDEEEDQYLSASDDHSASSLSFVEDEPEEKNEEDRSIGHRSNRSSHRSISKGRSGSKDDVLMMRNRSEGSIRTAAAGKDLTRNQSVKSITTRGFEVERITTNRIHIGGDQVLGPSPIAKKERSSTEDHYLSSDHHSTNSASFVEEIIEDEPEDRGPEKNDEDRSIRTNRSIRSRNRSISNKSRSGKEVLLTRNQSDVSIMTTEEDRSIRTNRSSIRKSRSSKEVLLTRHGSDVSIMTAEEELTRNQSVQSITPGFEVQRITTNRIHIGDSKLLAPPVARKRSSTKGIIQGHPSTSSSLFVEEAEDEPEQKNDKDRSIRSNRSMSSNSRSSKEGLMTRHRSGGSISMTAAGEDRSLRSNRSMSSKSRSGQERLMTRHRSDGSTTMLAGEKLTRHQSMKSITRGYEVERITTNRILIVDKQQLLAPPMARRRSSTKRILLPGPHQILRAITEDDDAAVSESTHYSFEENAIRSRSNEATTRGIGAKGPSLVVSSIDVNTKHDPTPDDDGHDDAPNEERKTTMSSHKSSCETTMQKDAVSSLELITTSIPQKVIDGDETEVETETETVTETETEEDETKEEEDSKDIDSSDIKDTTDAKRDAAPLSSEMRMATPSRPSFSNKLTTVDENSTVINIRSRSGVVDDVVDADKDNDNDDDDANNDDDDCVVDDDDSTFIGNDESSTDGKLLDHRGRDLMDRYYIVTPLYDDNSMQDDVNNGGATTGFEIAEVARPPLSK